MFLKLIDVYKRLTSKILYKHWHRRQDEFVEDIILYTVSAAIFVWTIYVFIAIV